VNEGFLYGTHAVIIQVAFFALLLAAAEAGYRLGRSSSASKHVGGVSPISTVEASILGILALLLGFTMSMAVSRFEVRRQLVLNEANALRTSQLRAQLVPAPDGPEIDNLLRHYIEVRVQYGTAGEDLARLNDLHTQTAVLQTELWARAVAYAEKDPSPVRAGLLLQSLNEAIDLDAARWMAIRDQVPQNVIYVNATVGLLAALIVGYSFGVNGRRNIFSMCLLAMAITLVLAVIIDLDRPRSGRIGASQQPMIDLLHRP
jgi:type II secretory pathway pseudopilin PulG